MPTLLSVLDLGRGGISAQLAGISVTAENINGVNTPGYVRRSARLESFLRTQGVAGGVNYAGTDRAFDSFAYRRLIVELGHRGAASSRGGALRSAEAVVTPSQGGTIADRISGLFSAFSELAQKADDPTARAVVIARAEEVARDFNAAAAGLGSLRADLFQQAKGVATEVNERLERIADLNQRIQQAQQPDGARAELMDQRDRLVTEVGEMIGVAVVEDPSGSITLLSSGASLVDGGVYGQLDVTLGPTGDLEITVNHGTASTDVTSHVVDGQLGGLREARDVDLVKLATDLDQMAADFTSSVNAVHATGFGLDGVGGRNLFTDPGGAPIPPPPGTAALITLNPLIAANPDAVAASSDALDLPGGNSLAVALSLLGAVPMPGGDTPAERFAALAGALGAELSSADGELAMRESTVAHAQTLRDSASGVSLDEEMINLTRYQRAYEASLKVLQTADEMLTELVRMV